MNFNEREIRLLVSLLEAEQKKSASTLNFFDAEIESTYSKLTEMLKAASIQDREENGYHCERCQCSTPERELDANGLCLACQLKELND